MTMAILVGLGLTNSTLTIAIPIFVLLAFGIQSRLRSRVTRLQGPPSNSSIFGVTKVMFDSSDLGGLYNQWEKIYGPVYEIPSSLGSKILVLGDPKGIAHFFTSDTTRYHQLKFNKSFFGQTVGIRVASVESVLLRLGSSATCWFPWTERTIRGKSAAAALVSRFEFAFVRHRRALSLAFSNSAIRNLTAVSLDTAHKVKEADKGCDRTRR